MTEQETIANLNRLLKSQRAKIKKLQSKLEAAEDKASSLEYQLRDDVLGWSNPREWEESDLPLPRLELRWSSLDDSGYHSEAVLMFVYRHFLDGFGDKRDIQAMPMGRTKRSGGAANFTNHRGGLDMPFREGARAIHNAKHLGLPLFITTDAGDVVRVDATDGASTTDGHAQTWIKRAQ